MNLSLKDSCEGWAPPSSTGPEGSVFLKPGRRGQRSSCGHSQQRAQDSARPLLSAQTPGASFPPSVTSSWPHPAALRGQSREWNGQEARPALGKAR